jgi:hypothetical protein
MSSYVYPIRDTETIRSTNDLFKSEQDRKNKTNVNSTLITAGAVAGSYLGFKYANSRVSYSGKNSWMTFMNSASSNNLGNKTSSPRPYSTFKEQGRLTPGDFLLEGIRKVEEYSPRKVARTFQLSPLLAPFLSSQKSQFFISPDDIKSQKNYWEKLLQAEGNEALGYEALNSGLVFKNNKLYLAGADKAPLNDRVLLNEARQVFPYFKVPGFDDKGLQKEGIFVNRVFDNYSRLYGNFDIKEARKEGRLPMMVIGAKNSSKLNYQYGIRAFGRSVFQTGAEALDDGLEFARNYTGGNKTLNKVIDGLKTNLGTGGEYHNSVRSSTLKMAKNWGTKIAIGGAAYYGFDAIVRATAADDSYFSNGIFAGLAASYANTRVKYAEAISDHTQKWKSSQEEIAPGSTNISTMIGLPASFAVAGAMASYGQFLIHANKTDYATATKSANEIKGVFGTNLLKSGRLGRYAKIGALVGLALEAPFIPGALFTGESSEELRREYTGEKDVAVRSNRFWETGGSTWEGGKIKYFRPSLVYQAMNDTHTVSLYGDQATKAKLNPFLHPFDYLRDPYRLEKLTDEERPYPVWGMDISSGSFLAKGYEKTIGAIIKPDKLNPRALETLKPEENGSYAYDANITPGEKSLIDEGKMLAPQNARTDYNAEALRWSYKAFKEFIGIKGFALDQLQTGAGFDIDSINNLQLARSGEMTDLARELSELDLGDIGGFGEIQRRATLTNSGALQQRFNNIKNKMPDWLPHDDTNYFINFQTGDPYRKIEEGDVRLPGKGYEYTHPELKGLDANDYPDIYKYRILSDVALGSKEYYHYKKETDKRFSRGDLSEAEAKIYSTIKNEEAERSNNKKFFERKSEEDIERLGKLKGGAAKYWEFLTHDVSEAPYEKLFPIRPSSKFIHQRSAIEDYEATQLDTGDAAIWEKPYEHFLSPAITQTVRDFGIDYRPKKTEQRYNVEEYFDKLEYFKYRKLYKESIAEGDTRKAYDYKRDYSKTIQGSLTSDMKSQRDVLYSFIALPKRERDYFGSFVNTDDETQREKIRSLVPKQVGALYNELWSRKDILNAAYNPETGQIENAKAQEQIELRAYEESETLAKTYSKEYNNYNNNIELQKQGSFKEYLADLDAASYIEATTGTPDKNFIGWDPRIDLKDVKVRTLSIGGDDLYDYGLYKNDVQQVKRMIAVLNDKQIATKLNQLKDDSKRKKELEESVRQTLIDNKIDPLSIAVLPTKSGTGKMVLNVQENNG